MSGLDPLKIYDLPGVLASQVLEDEVTLEGLKNLALSPESLSPKERSDLGDRILAGEEDPSGVKKALVGALTNPFVWMYFMTGPAGGEFARKGVALFGRTPAARAKQAVQKFPGLLQNLGLLSGHQMGSETMIFAQKHAQRAVDEVSQHRNTALGLGDDSMPYAVTRRLGLDRGADPSKYPKGSEKWRKAMDIQTGWSVLSHGMHTDKIDSMVQGRTGYRVLENGQIIHAFDDTLGLEKWKAGIRYTERKAALEDILYKFEYEVAPEAKKQYEASREAAYQKWRKTKSPGEKFQHPSWSEVREELLEKMPGYDDAKGVKDLRINEYATTEMAQKGTYQMFEEERLRRFFFEENPDLGEFFLKQKQVNREILVKALGQENLGTETVEFMSGVSAEMPVFKVDEKKLTRWARGVEMEVFAEGAGKAPDDVYEGRAVLNQLLGPEQMKAIENGTLTQEQAMAYARDTLSVIEDNYFYSAMNMQSGYEVPASAFGAGMPAPKEDLVNRSVVFGLDAPEVGNTTTPRTTRDTHIWNPDQLQHAAKGGA